jgi:hypothetical protein
VKIFELDGHGAHDAAVAEVYDERQRFSATNYVALLRGVYLGGPRTGADEWSRYIHRLSPDAYEAFFLDVDSLIEAGELWEVPTPEQVAEIRARVLARKDEIQADGARSMHRRMPEFQAEEGECE